MSDLTYPLALACEAKTVLHSYFSQVPTVPMEPPVPLSKVEVAVENTRGSERGANDGDDAQARAAGAAAAAQGRTYVGCKCHGSVRKIDGYGLMCLWMSYDECLTFSALQFCGHCATIAV